MKIVGVALANVRTLYTVATVRGRARILRPSLYAALVIEDG